MGWTKFWAIFDDFSKVSQHLHLQIFKNGPKLGRRDGKINFLITQSFPEPKNRIRLTDPSLTKVVSRDISKNKNKIQLIVILCQTSDMSGTFQGSKNITYQELLIYFICDSIFKHTPHQGDFLSTYGADHLLSLSNENYRNFFF